MNRPDPSRMIRTTVYLPAESIDRARVAAATRGVTVAAVVRSALDSAFGAYRPPPTGGFLSAGKAGTAGTAGTAGSGRHREISDL